MTVENILHALREREDYRDQIVHIERIPGQSAVFSDPHRPISSTLSAGLHKIGIDRLFSHQAAAIDAIEHGENVVVVTATASGKSLCYNIPAVEAALQNSNARSLYLFPTKALAQDQQGKLNDLGVFPQVRFATYDGDTAQEDRRYIKRGAHIVLTNPDMLHLGILPYHTSWTSFFANLRFIVLDEIHSYRGVFGSNVAQVIRRLRRICDQYGASPQFIACSATIANPGDLFKRLTGLDAVTIDNNGSPTARRTFVFWNPPTTEETGDRGSAHIEASNLFTELVMNNVRNITFARARKSAELILRYARERFDQMGSELSGRIMSYRAGYNAEDRRAIEKGLLNGDFIGVTSTNALELGVDVGGLDATVLTGYPGTIASTWQQAGRAGRDGGNALNILIGLDGPLDQYLMRHPEYFFGQIHESAIVDPNNTRILSRHLVCAAYELPLTEQDLDRFGPASHESATALVDEGTLVLRNGRYYFRGSGYPASEVNLRSASAETYSIRERSTDGKLIGTVEGARVYQTVHTGAIYLHQGETYRVRELNEDLRRAVVESVDLNFYTEPRELTHISVIAEHSSRSLGTSTAYFGEVVVTNQVLGYRCKQLYSDTVVDVVDLDLPEQAFETEGLWFTVPAGIISNLAEKGLDLCGAIHAAEHACIGMMPLFSISDRWDLGGVSTPHHPDTGMSTVFIYDGYPGGIGITESTYSRLEDLFRVTADMIASCPCKDGCPSCVQSPKCGNNNEPLDKHGALLVLNATLGNYQTAGKESPNEAQDAQTVQA
jgi:DEAD/DEAH box helicase domain-containing protein